MSQAFSWICSALRLYVRFAVVRTPGWDDMFLVLALVRSSESFLLL